MNLLFLGAPGAGKGTQADIIAKKLKIPTISTGNILRAAVKNRTPVGLRAAEYMDRGALVPDEVIIDIVRERLAEKDCAGGYILDGMPRTLAQAKALENAGVQIDAAVSIDVPDEVIVKRMAGRRTCPACGASYHVTANPPRREGVCDACGAALTIRKDDAPETVLQRLATYHEQTEPLIGFYTERDRIRHVDGTQGLEETTAAICAALGI